MLLEGGAMAIGARCGPDANSALYNFSVRRNPPQNWRAGYGRRSYTQDRRSW